MRWLWIDRFSSFEPGRRARAVKNIARGEEFLTDHFAAWPVMPASLIIEGMAQTGGILVGHARSFQEKVILAKVVKAAFRGEALPGDQLVFDAEIAGEVRDQGAAVLGTVTRVRDGAAKPLADIEMMFAHVDKGATIAGPPGVNFVFDANFLQLVGSYRLESLAPAKE